MISFFTRYKTDILWIIIFCLDSWENWKKSKISNESHMTMSERVKNMTEFAKLLKEEKRRRKL